MKKTHSVFFDLPFDELMDLVHPILKRKGLLKDIPNDADRSLFDGGEMTIEYHWEDDLDA